jgi:hypothetical protein
LNDLWQYDPTTDTWAQKANYPGGKRDGLGVFVIGNKAYVGGGSDNNYVYSQFYEYDATADKWTQKTDIPEQGDIFPSMFSIGNYGYTVCGAGASEYTDLYRYDPSSDSWDSYASFPGDPRQACISFVLNGKAYVGSGQSQYDTTYTDMFSYDPSTDNWSNVPSLPAQGRAWATAGVIGDTAYIGNGAYFKGGNILYLNDWWGFSSTFTASVSNKSSIADRITCYPLPASSFVRISGIESGKEYSVRVLDAAGRNIKTEVLASTTGSDPLLNISSIATGSYELLISNGTTFYTPPFIKY